MTTKEFGLTVRTGAASTVKFTGITTGALEAWDAREMDAEYVPGASVEKFAAPTVKLPGTAPLVGLLATSQLPPVVTITEALKLSVPLLELMVTV